MTEPTWESYPFTAEEVIQIAEETSDTFGNLYRIDFIHRIRHEAQQQAGTRRMAVLPESEWEAPHE